MEESEKDTAIAMFDYRQPPCLIVSARPRWRHRRLRLRLGLSLRCLRLRRGGRLPLHIDAAAEVRALGDSHARRDDVTVHGSAVADVDLLAGGDVAVHLAEHDDGLGEHLCLDLAVGPMVSTWSFSSILPSTCPSTVRSRCRSARP
jgi:hypothetical protein